MTDRNWTESVKLPQNKREFETNTKEILCSSMKKAVPKIMEKILKNIPC